MSKNDVAKETLRTISLLREADLKEENVKQIRAILEYIGAELVQTMDGEWICISKGGDE